MNENALNKKNLISNIIRTINNNLKIIIVLLSSCFIIFLFFQLFIFYTSSKIKKNSIDFFNSQNFEDQNLVEKSIIKLSEENDFYGLLSKLELIEINIKNENYDFVINLYNELLKNNNLDSIYQSAIASKAAYQFIDINLTDFSKNYSEIIKSFINFIDDELSNFQDVKLELSYLLKILELDKNNNEYTKSQEAIELYNNIMNSDSASSIIKERVKKINEFYSYK